MEFEPDTPDEVKERFRLQGACLVNGVLFTNMSRYGLAKHPELFSKNEMRLARRHLKDCPECRAEIEREKIK